MSDKFELIRVERLFNKKPQDSDWVTIEKILAQRPKMIFYGAMTPWWTHKGEHLSKLQMRGKLKILNMSGEVIHEEPTGPFPTLPCDTRGGTLFQTDNIKSFFESARGKPETYGRHGLKALELAHHENHSIALKNWDEYNAALDQFLRGNQIGLNRLRDGYCPYCFRVLGLKDSNQIWFCDICGFRVNDEMKRSLEQ